jgi:hypothetical protein
MKTLPTWFKFCGRFALVCLFTASAASWQVTAADATNSIVWHAESNTLDVDIDNKPLSVVVADFKKATGREIHVPPGMTKTVSLKFSGKPMSEGLARILDGFNYYGETHGEVSRIVIVDPNGAPPVPTGVRTAATMPRPPAAMGGMGNRPPGGSSGFSGQPGGFSGSRGDGRGGDGRSGGSTSSDRDRTPRTQEQITLEMLVREAAKSSGAGGGGDRIRPSSGSGGPSSSGKSKSPR